MTLPLMHRGARLAVLCLLSTVCWTACSGPRPDELVVAPQVASAEEQAGEGVFMRFCNGCHPAGLGGLGPGIINKPLPSFAMRLQVRRGLGAMPGFSERVIPGDDLDALIAYIHAMRQDRTDAGAPGR
jgi:mono/diheme cytochrome c family protein